MIRQWRGLEFEILVCVFITLFLMMSLRWRSL